MVPAHCPLPHTLVLDLGGQYQVDGFRYVPRQDGSPNGTIARYQFYVSDHSSTWGTAVAVGSFAADTTEKTVRFPAKTGRYVRLVALSEINGKPWTSAAELNIFGAAVPSATTRTSSLLAQSVTTAPVTSSTSTSTTTAGISTTSKASTTMVQSWCAHPAGLWLLGWGRNLQTAPGFPRAQHLALQNDGDRSVKQWLT
jgi:hypothetical protein